MVDRRQHRRAGRAPGDGLIWRARVPRRAVCAHGADERFCEDCGLPLVRAGVRAAAEVRARASAPARSARATPRARSCAPRGRATRRRRSSSRACCSRRASRRSRAARAASTCPDFLAAGPRDILVPSSGLEAAREILGEPHGDRAGAPAAAATRAVGARAGGDARRCASFTAFAAASPCRSLTSPVHASRFEVRAPRALGVPDASAGRRSPALACGPSGCGPRASVTHARSPSSRASRSTTLPPRSTASTHARGERGSDRPPAAGARSPVTSVRGLASEPLRGPLHEPRPARPAGEPRRASPAAAASGGCAAT